MKKIYNNSVKVTKTFGTKKINVIIRLDDTCGNGVCDFSITATIYEQLENGRWVDIMSGCCRDEILKVFPEFADFVSLHLSNVHGQPMYPVANGLYWLKKEGIKKCADYLRIDEETAQMLSTEPDYFKYQLFALGIVDKWQREADAAIRHFEELKGEKWINPYSEDEETHTLRLTEDERNKVENLIISGYYEPERINERENARKEEKRRKERNAIIERFDKDIRNAQTEKAVYLCVFDMLGTTENVIYYTHSNTICFNWREYGDKWTQEQFIDFVNSVDKSQLPENINFQIK